MAVVCTTTLPAVRADYCTKGTAKGRIDTVYFTRVGDALADWTDATEWNTRLDNSTAAPSSGDYPIRYLNGIGSLTQPDQNTVDISLDRVHYSDPNFTINFAVDDVGADNYDFAQSIVSTNGGIFACWFTGGGYMYGGTAGTQMSMNIYPDIPEDNTDIMRLRMTLTWEGGLPDRITNPLA